MALAKSIEAAAEDGGFGLKEILAKIKDGTLGSKYLNSGISATLIG